MASACGEITWSCPLDITTSAGRQTGPCVVEGILGTLGWSNTIPECEIGQISLEDGILCSEVLLSASYCIFLLLRSSPEEAEPVQKTCDSSSILVLQHPLGPASHIGFILNLASPQLFQCRCDELISDTSCANSYPFHLGMYLSGHLLDFSRSLFRFGFKKSCCMFVC